MEKRKPPLWAALTAYVIGWLWACCFVFGFYSGVVNYMHDWYVLLFAGVFFLWAEACLHRRRGIREHWFWLACMVLTALAISLKGDRAADGLGYLALHGFAGYWVLCRAGLLTEGSTGPFLPADLADAFVLTPFGNFFLRIVTIFSAVKNRIFLGNDRKQTMKNAGISAMILVLAFPFFLLAGNLLGQADAEFEKIFANLGGLFTLDAQWRNLLTEQFARFLFGLPVGAYLFGMAGGALCREKPMLNADETKKKLELLRIAPNGTFTAVLCGFAGLYLLFFVIQAKHLLAAFWGIVPGTLTAAQFAREGFFQLLAVMAINFGLLAAAAKLSRIPIRSHRILRPLAAGLMVESLFLAVTAASKLVLYIQRFGYTPLRVLSSWAVAVMTAGCLLALVSLKRNCRAIHKWVLFAAGTFTVICFI